MRRRPDTSPGFTLLEVVVTLAVLSLSLTALYQIYSSVARGTRVSADYYRALQIAESQMALLSARVGMTTGGSGVVDEYYRWRASVNAYTPPSDGPLSGDGFTSASEMGQQTYLLNVTVSWGDAREHDLELTTIRLGDRS